MTEPRARLLAALDSDGELLRQLILEWMPIVQVRVARILGRWSRARDVEQEVADLTQDVFTELFADDARVLRSWDPARGLSLSNFVGLVAERRAGRILSTLRRSPWTESPEDLTELEIVDVDPTLALESRDFLETLYHHVRASLTPRGLELFELLLVQGEPVEAVCSRTGMTPEAVWAWRSRLVKVVRMLGEELMKKISSAKIAAAKPTLEGA